MEELQSFLRENGYDEKVVAVIRQNVRQLMTQEDVGFANMQLQDTLESSEGIVALFIVQNLLRQLNLGWTEQVFLRETGFDPDRNNSNASDLYITTLMRDGQSTILESLIEWYERNERSIITDGGFVRSIRAHVSGDGGKMAVKRNVMDREQNDKKIRKVMGNQQVLLTSPNLTQQSHHPKRRALSTMMSLEELDHNLPSRVGPIANVVPTVVEASEESAPCNRLPLRDDGEQEPRKLTVQEVDHKPNLMESFDKSDPSHERSLEVSSKRPNHLSNRLDFWRGAQLENGKYVAAERVDDVLDKSMNEDANAVQDRFHGTSQDETQETWVPLLPHANRTFVLTQYQTHKLRKLLGVPNYMYFKRTTYQIGDAFLINSNQTVLNLLGLDPPDQDSSASESNRFSDDKQYVRNNGFVDKCTSDDSPELASTPIASNRRRNLQVSFAQEQTSPGESQHSHSESALARRSLIDRFRRNLSKEDVGNDPDQSRTACLGHACSNLKRLRNRQLDGTHTKSLPHNASFWSTKTNYSMTTGTTTEKRSPDRIPSSVCPSLRSTKSNATPSNSHTVLTTTFDMSSQVLSPILKEVVEDALNQPRNDPALSCAQKMQQTKLANGLQFEEGGDGFLTGYLNVTYKLPPGMDNSLIVHSVMNGAIDLEPKIIELVVRDESDIEVDVDVKLAAKSFQGAFNSGDMQRWKLLGSKSMGGSRSHSSLPLTKTEQRNLKRTLQVNIPVIVQRTGSRITISPQTSFCRKRCSK